MSVLCDKCQRPFCSYKALCAHSRVHKEGYENPGMRRALKIVDDLLEYVETARPSGYAPWRDFEKRRMAEIVMGAEREGRA